MSGTFISIRAPRSSRPISAACAQSSAWVKTSRPSSKLCAALATDCAMSPHWPEILRKTSARLALLYVWLFGVSVAVLFGLVYWAATTALSDRIDQDLALQRDALIARAAATEEGVMAAVGDALRSHGEFRYLVRDAG